jgi:predicted metal-dependent hydrolase
MAVARSGNGTGPAPDGITDPAPSAVEVRRSGRRRRTVSAYREGGRTIVLIPARFTEAEERHWVDTMLGRLAAGDRRRRPDDAELSARARALSSRYLADAAGPTSVRWVGNQMSRWGSCTPSDGTIRVSERLKGMPGYVLDYVLLHELAHLLRPAHDREFWRLLAGYPRVERARGYLEGVAAAAGLGAWPDDWTDGEAGEPVDLLGSGVGPVDLVGEPTTLF